MKKLLLPYLFLLPCFTPLLAQNSQQLAPMPFIMDMVHNNPGEAPYVTKYTDGQFLASHGYNSCVPHWHINCAVTYDSYRKNMVARHSDERRWIEQRAATISRKLDSLKQAGLQVYPFTDFVVFPQSVWKAYGKEIGGEGQVAGGTSTDGRTRSVNIRSERTQQLLRAQIAEIFDRFPQLDGLVTRFGETYLHDTPFHSGGSPISTKEAQADHRLFINILREEICVKRGKKLFYRTWDFGYNFHNNPQFYLAVTDSIEPHDNLFFVVKYQQGDFHRNCPFNPTVGIGRHKQVIESQSRMEAYGKGAHPYYVASGVIDGWPETRYKIDWKSSRMTDQLQAADAPRGLRDKLSSRLLAGVMTWSHGGGWRGPYIKHEIWTDLNSYVVAQWGLHPDRTEEELFRQFTDSLQLTSRNADIFRQIALLSIEGVRKGHMNSYVHNNPWWTRDEFFSAGGCKNMVSEIMQKGLKEKVLAEKAESSAIWEQIESLALQFEAPDSQLQEAVRVSATYGRIKYQLIEQMWRMMLENAETQPGKAIIQDAISRYDQLWHEWHELEKHPLCASLYTDQAFPGQRKGSIGELVERLRKSISGSVKRVLYIGDSITDGAWGNSGGSGKPSDKRNHWDQNHLLGHGYVYLCAARYTTDHPAEEVTFMNRGISGDSLMGLKARWQQDVIAQKPDLLSVLIGTNDVNEWLRYGHQQPFDFTGWELTYRSLLDSARIANPDIHLVLCSPFVAPSGKVGKAADFALRQETIAQLRDIVERIARDYNASFVDFNALYTQLQQQAPRPDYWIWDGIHPTPAGHQQMADLWMRTVAFNN